MELGVLCHRRDLESIVLREHQNLIKRKQKEGDKLLRTLLIFSLFILSLFLKMGAHLPLIFPPLFSLPLERKKQKYFLVFWMSSLLNFIAPSSLPLVSLRHLLPRSPCKLWCCAAIEKSFGIFFFLWQHPFFCRGLAERSTALFKSSHTIIWLYTAGGGDE